MEQSGLSDRIERLVMKNSRLELTSVDHDSRLNFDLGFDSHALLNLLLDIEDEFGLEIDPAEVPDLVGSSVAELVARVAQRQASAQPAEGGVG